MPLSNQEMRIWMFETMVKSRRFDNRLIEIYAEGKLPVFDFAAGPLPGELHSSNGQEPCAVGVCAHLGPDDSITAGHRPHHVAIARGVDMKRMAAEIFGRVDGLSAGRGGHMHIYDPNVNFSSSGIIAEGIGPAAGIAFSRKTQNKLGVAVTFFGEGAANQGAFHEVMNLAGLWKLPFIAVVEDNGYGVATPKSKSTAVERNSDRAKAYGVKGEFVGGNDADSVSEVAREAVERARSGGGATLIEIETTRLTGHFWGDPQAYRPEGEVANLVDPIPRYKERLISEGVLSTETAEELSARAEAEADEAIEFGLASPYPDPAAALEKVYAETTRA